MSILDEIIAHKKTEIQAFQPPEAYDHQPLDFVAALASADPTNRVSLIAEVKKASPSKGVIRADFDPVRIAQAYQQAGADCISVLTDEHFFQGSLDYLKAIRQAVALPLLRKDFVLDPSQVYEARVAGADAVLLIAECLAPSQLKDLHDLIVELGMTPLVELYEEKNIDAVLACGPSLVGVNNRDLNTFEVDLQHSIRIRKQLPDSVTFVSESGIFTNEDIQLMQDNDVDAVLVGESLMRSDDIAAAVHRLMGTEQSKQTAKYPSLPKLERSVRKPKRDEYHEFYQRYVSLISEEALAERMESQADEMTQQLQSLEDPQVNCLHEPYTWTLKQVVGHLIDCERVFSDRMLRIGVGDQTPIPGIDQQMFVQGIDYAGIMMDALLDEFRCLRRANVRAVNRLSNNDLLRRGTASDTPVSSRANLYILVGHCEYHLRIIRQRVAKAKQA